MGIPIPPRSLRNKNKISKTNLGHLLGYRELDIETREFIEFILENKSR